jgi:SARP family transcriptional regulator, regulator of embCAB operon
MIIDDAGAKGNAVECDFKLLGPIAVKIGGEVCTPSARKIRQVLALMLLRANQVVGLDSAIEELWGDSPPRTAVTIVQTYIYQLRKLLVRNYGARHHGAVIKTAAPGYVLSMSDRNVDCWQFAWQLRRGRDTLEHGDPREAAALLNSALGMWTGSALENIEHGPVLTGYAAGLEEQRMLALELRLRAEMQLGRHRELIPELKSLVAAHPYHEWLHAQLMIALKRSGRRGEALTAYQAARQVLNSELGLEPSAVLQRIHRSVLNADVVVA